MTFSLQLSTATHFKAVLKHSQADCLLFRTTYSRVLRRCYTTSKSNMDSSKAAHDFLSFVNASPTRKLAFLLMGLWKIADLLTSLAFHAVHSVKQRLSEAGFKEIKVNLPFGGHAHVSTLLMAELGTGSLGFDMSAGWEILPHPQYFHNLGICNRQEMEGLLLLFPAV